MIVLKLMKRNGRPAPLGDLTPGSGPLLPPPEGSVEHPARDGDWLWWWRSRQERRHSIEQEASRTAQVRGTRGQIAPDASKPTEAECGAACPWRVAVPLIVTTSVAGHPVR